MAYTKIHAIKTTVNKAIAYICNPDKTDEGILISSFACAPETAAIDFKYTLDHCRENDLNKAYHLVQAFAPGEVSYEEAHEIGKQLADKVLEGKYSYVVTTHIDKGHVHNHIIFCAADNINYDKYNDCEKTYYRIRKLSDELCRAHGLSVIKSSKKRGEKYNQWQTRTQIRKDINAAIRAAATYKEFLFLMKAKGYEIAGETFGEEAAKYITFRPLGKERPVRGSVKILGKEYTKERIAERIEQKQKHGSAEPKKNYSSRQLVDTSEQKFQDSPGLLRWAAIENLKIASQTYNEISSFAELKQEIALKDEVWKSSKQSVVKLEHQIKDLSEIIKYAEQYKENRAYHIGYKKSKNPEAYFRKHESQIILYGGARRMLEQAGVKLKGLDIEKLKAKRQRMMEEKKKFTTTYKKFEKETSQLKQKLKTLEQFLDNGMTNSKENISHDPSL